MAWWDDSSSHGKMSKYNSSQPIFKHILHNLLKNEEYPIRSSIKTDHSVSESNRVFPISPVVPVIGSTAADSTITPEQRARATANMQQGDEYFN